MNRAERIKRDIALFERRVNELDSISFADNEAEVICHAKRYYKDTKYYLEKNDYFTAFGCINYAHGLIDGIKKYGEVLIKVRDEDKSSRSSKND